MLEIIRTLKGRFTILLIEHKLDLVMQLSDRVVVMDDGAKIAEGLPPRRRVGPRRDRRLSGLARGRARARPPRPCRDRDPQARPHQLVLRADPGPL
jgi:branched-chain amino acid transport system ATP-binding protein